MTNDADTELDKARRANEIAQKVGQAVGPLFNAILPENTSAMVVLCFENDPTKVALLSTLGNLERMAIINSLAANISLHMLSEAVQAAQAKQSNQDELNALKTEDMIDGNAN